MEKIPLKIKKKDRHDINAILYEMIRAPCDPDIFHLFVWEAYDENIEGSFCELPITKVTGILVHPSDYCP